MKILSHVFGIFSTFSKNEICNTYWENSELLPNIDIVIVLSVKNCLWKVDFLQFGDKKCGVICEPCGGATYEPLCIKIVFIVHTRVSHSTRYIRSTTYYIRKCVHNTYMMILVCST